MRMSGFSKMVLIIVSVSISMSFPYNVSADETRPWDVNGDGLVDMADVILVGSHLGDSPAVDGDVNGDG